MSAAILLTVKQACRELSVCRSTLHTLIRRGEIVPFKDGRMVRIPRREIESYIRRNTHKKRYRRRADLRSEAAG